MLKIVHDETDVSYLGIIVAAIIFDEAGQILLIKENYGKRRYGPPGGTVEAGESPQQAVMREVMEEICVKVRISRLVGMYYFKAEGSEPWLAFTFRCEIESGNPTVPSTGEIAEIGWFNPSNLPSPLTNLAPHAIADAVAGESGIVRDIFLS